MEIRKPPIDDGHAEQERLTEIGLSLHPEYVDSKRIIGRMRWAAEERLGASHRMSDLVIRKRKDAPPVLASFIYYYTAEHLVRGCVARPSEWLIMDIISGAPIARYVCKEKEFSDAPYNRLYSLSAKDEMDLSAEYYRNAYNLLDEARIAYLQTGKLDSEKYIEYVKRILKNIPPDFSRFFIDLGGLKVTKKTADGADAKK